MCVTQDVFELLAALPPEECGLWAAAVEATVRTALAAYVHVDDVLARVGKVAREEESTAKAPHVLARRVKQNIDARMQANGVDA